MQVFIGIEGSVHGNPTPYDGELLSRYEPEAHDGLGEIWSTREIADALKFADARTALDVLNKVSEIRPLREDGKPNRPIRRFTVTVMNEAHAQLFLAASPPGSVRVAGHIEKFRHTVAARQDWMFYVWISSRPGGLALAMAVEWYWFDPHTPLNNDFQIYEIAWREMTWLVFACPAIRHDDIKKLAAQIGMRVADGVPRLIMPHRPGMVRLGGALVGAGMETFPGGIEGEKNMWSIENAFTPPDPIAAYARESKLRGIFLTGGKPTPRAIHEFIWGDTAP